MQKNLSGQIIPYSESDEAEKIVRCLVHFNTEIEAFFRLLPRFAPRNDRDIVIATKAVRKAI